MLKKILPVFIVFMIVACIASAGEKKYSGFWVDHLEEEVVTFSGRIERSASNNSLDLVIFDDYKTVKINKRRLPYVTITDVPGDIIKETRRYSYGTTKREYSNSMVSYTIVEIKAKCVGEKRKKFPDFKFISLKELKIERP
jgi:hypothetical protein